MPDYRLGFFFLMDLIGTLSLILDIEWILTGLGIDLSEGNADASVLRAARTARVGARAGRLTRAVRIIKVLRLQTLVKRVPMLQKIGWLRKLSAGDDDQVKDVKPSLIGKKIAEEISKKVAALVILMVLVVPTLSSVINDQSAQAFSRNFNLLRKSDPVHNQQYIWNELQSFNEYYASHSTPAAGTPLFLSIFLDTQWKGTFCKNLSSQVPAVVSDNRRNCTWDWSSIYGEEKLRKNDVKVIVIDGVRTNFNQRSILNEAAMFNIFLTCSVVIVLLIFSVVFSMGMATLVVKPLERVMNIIYENTTNLTTELQQADHELEDETDALERAIAKMTKVLNLVGGRLNNTGGGMLEDTIKNRNLDEGTQAYLQQYTTAQQDNSLNKGDAASVDSGRQGSARNESFLIELGVSRLKDVNAVDSWQFNVFDYDEQQLLIWVGVMFTKLDLVQQNNLSVPVFSSFVSKIRGGYHATNQYHNFQHAMDVMHTMYRMLTVTDVRQYLSKLDIFAVMVASLAHDVDHPGLTNAYLVANKHPLAITYNDQSVLENRHASLLYTVLGQKESDIFASMSTADWAAARKLIVHCILATDNAFHFKHMSELTMLLDVNTDPMAEDGKCVDIEELFGKNEDKQLVLDMMLHCCDISNPWKPWFLCELWSTRIQAEFFAQGDLERNAGVPISPMMDRHTTGRGASGVNFAEFLVAPLLNAMYQILPELSPCLTTLCDNVESWAGIWEQEMNAQDPSVPGRVPDAAEREEQVKKLHARLPKFMEKYRPPDLKIPGPSKQKSRFS
jgi:cAMP-specific phosphodiesterase 4